MKARDFLYGALIAGGVTAASLGQEARTLDCDWQGRMDYPVCTQGGDFGNPMETLDGIIQLSSATT